MEECPKCKGTGLADSGGLQPWGEPIEIECDCKFDEVISKESRKKFEAWYVQKYCMFGDESDRSNERHAYKDVQLMWEAWQASRAAIEIELPVAITQQETCKYGLEPSDAYGLSWGSSETLSQCGAAIRAAGLRVKEQK